MNPSELPLAGRIIAIPETRQLEVFARLLEARGAEVLRCPLVSILDAEDAEPVLRWIDRLTADPAELIVFYTGEGVRRLTTAAGRSNRQAAFLKALACTKKLCRGPKPKRALRELGLSAELDADSPTTDGVVATLATLPLDDARVAVQLYAAEPPEALAAHLDARNIEADYVSPYVYAGESDDARVEALIGSLAAGRVDAIAFTSQAQVERLFKVAGRSGLEAGLREGLTKTRIAAVGPVVASHLRASGLGVDAEPERGFFLKPLVMKLCELFDPDGSAS